MSRPGFSLLAITPPTGPADPACVRAWVEGGATRVGIAVLLRTPGAGPRATYEDRRMLALRNACVEAGIPLLLAIDAHRLDELGASGLDLRTTRLSGMQLRGDPGDDALARARFLLPRDAPLGRSVHGAPRAADVDYTVFAPVFTPRTDQAGVRKPARGVTALAAWAAAVREPVFALGGVESETARDCLDAGARGLAGISVFFGPPSDVARRVQGLVRALAPEGVAGDPAPPIP